MVEFDRVDEALDEAAVQAAEAHGVLAGMVCAAATVEAEDWWAAIRTDTSPIEVPEPLQRLHAKTVASLADPSGSFDLFLPGDETPMEERAAALHDWCQGFLYGYGLARGQDPGKLSADAAEIFHDIRQFAQTNFELGEDGEEDEQAYSELVEYLRVAVLLLHETLHPRSFSQSNPAGAAAGSRLHPASRTLH